MQDADNCVINVKIRNMINTFYFLSLVDVQHHTAHRIADYKQLITRCNDTSDVTKTSSTNSEQELMHQPTPSFGFKGDSKSNEIDNLVDQAPSELPSPKRTLSKSPLRNLSRNYSLKKIPKKPLKQLRQVESDMQLNRSKER
jgi:hypothetical protein